MVALLLVFLVVGRMVEVRVDTGGLLLVNAAWAIAAVFAGLALLFSARAAGMVAVLGLLLLYLAARSRDLVTVRALLLVAGSFLAAGLALYLLAPESVNMVIRACFLEPSKLLAGRVPLAVRFLAPDRLPLTVLIAGGLLAGWKLLRSSAVELGVVVAVACGAQLLLILLDPSPFQYVYGWAAVPAVLGIVSASPLVALSLPLVIASGLVSLSVAFGLARGEAPPTGSYLRRTFDAP